MEILSSILAVSLSLVPLPSPTPNLGEVGQLLNFALLKDGLITSTKKVYGREYTVRKLRAIQILYNDKSHVIAIFKTMGPSDIKLGGVNSDPLINEEVKGTTKMDGNIYTIRYTILLKSVYGVVYNEKNKAILSILVPGPVSIIMPAGEEIPPYLNKL